MNTATAAVPVMQHESIDFCRVCQNALLDGDCVICTLPALMVTLRPTPNKRSRRFVQIRSSQRAL